MGAGMGFWDMLQRKYDILQQNADADTTRANADANINNVKAGLLPAESAAGNDFTRANTGLSIARGLQTSAEQAQVEEQTKTIAPLARASITNSNAQARLYGSQATGEDELNRFSRFRLKGLGDNYGALDDFFKNATRFGLGPFAGD